MQRGLNYLAIGDTHSFLPPMLKDTVARLDRLIVEVTDEYEKSRATRALAHLYKLLQSHDATGGGSV